MTYYLYHIPGKKIGVTQNLEERVHKQQGYYPGEYEIIEQSDDIDFISEGEQIMQNWYGYKVDEVPYNKLKFNNKEMNINITEQTTTFPCPINKLKGRLMDNLGMDWETDHGSCKITKKSIKWIMENIQISKYNDQRSYIYNKAFARYFDNNDPYNGKTIAGALSPDCGTNERQKILNPSQFDLIRTWADERGLYENGDTKTQALKLVEEVGETCRAILKENHDEVVDGIGDCVVVLTNLAELQGVSIEDCIEEAYHEIKNRKGKMENGTYVKDAK
jgi:NTP pyrophosphatase (non-canonical NTP hydrolase)